MTRRALRVAGLAALLAAAGGASAGDAAGRHDLGSGAPVAAAPSAAPAPRSAPSDHPRLRARDVDVDRGGLPEPASWALMVVGVGMIGAALRGFIITNRHLARLQPGQLE